MQGCVLAKAFPMAELNTDQIRLVQKKPHELY